MQLARPDCSFLVQRPVLLNERSSSGRVAEALTSQNVRDVSGRYGRWEGNDGSARMTRTPRHVLYCRGRLGPEKPKTETSFLCPEKGSYKKKETVPSKRF